MASTAVGIATQRGHAESAEAKLRSKRRSSARVGERGVRSSRTHSASPTALQAMPGYVPGHPPPSAGTSRARAQNHAWYVIEREGRGREQPFAERATRSTEGHLVCAVHDLGKLFRNGRSGRVMSSTRSAAIVAQPAGV